MIVISSLIPYGAQNAVTASHLASVTGFPVRTITRAIRYARTHGIPVCASCGTAPGYYIAADAEELAAYRKRLLHRCRAVLGLLEALELAQNTLSGQQAIDGYYHATRATDARRPRESLSEADWQSYGER